MDEGKWQRLTTAALAAGLVLHLPFQVSAKMLRDGDHLNEHVY